MIEVVFAETAPSKLGLVLRDPPPPASDGDPVLASAMLFAILDRCAGFPYAATLKQPRTGSTRTSPHVVHLAPATSRETPTGEAQERP